MNNYEQLKPFWGAIGLILKQQGRLVDGQNPLMAKAEEGRPAIVAMTPEHRVAIGIPVQGDAGRPVRQAVFGEELLQQLIESWGGALGVPGTLVSLKLHLPFLVVFHMRCPSGKVSGSGCGGFPFGVVQQFIIDGRICRILPPDLHVSPPRGRTS